MATEDSGFSRSTEPVFETVRRGFDPDQVLGYLKRVGDRIRQLESQLHQAEADLQEARQERDRARTVAGQDPYVSASAHVADLMRTFDKEVERMRAEAQDDAERIRAEARAEVERARREAGLAEADARSQAEAMISEARAEADQVREDLAALHDATLRDLMVMRDHMVSSVREIDQLLRVQRSEEPVVLVDESGNGSSGDGEASSQRHTSSELGV